MEYAINDDIKKSAKEFTEFYFDLVENQISSLPLHLPKNVILDWFGQTVKDPKKIPIFLKDHASNAKHLFYNVEPCESVGYRDSHILNNKYSAVSKVSDNCTEVNIARDTQEKTPPNSGSSTGTLKGSQKREKRERGQGDGHHNCNLESPVKRTCITGDVSVESPSSPLKILNVSSEGHMEFRRKSSKKYQKEIKWSRPCKFQAAYSEASTGYIIHRIIYQGNMRCRRNLLKEFEALGQDK